MGINDSDFIIRCELIYEERCVPVASLRFYHKARK